MERLIFFDLDGTLWSAGHPLLRPAWERLPSACQQILGKLPEGFRWQNYAGGTDLGVVNQIVNDLKPTAQPEGRKELTALILNQMDRYYLEHGPKDITPALFSDTKGALEALVARNWRLGVVTGNTLQVARLKIAAADLTDYLLRDAHFIFTGEMADSRNKLLSLAYSQVLIAGLRSPGLFPLIYVADTIRDLEEADLARHLLSLTGMRVETRVLLRVSDWRGEISLPPRITHGVLEKFRVTYFDRINRFEFWQEIDRPAVYNWVPVIPEERPYF